MKPSSNASRQIERDAGTTLRFTGFTDKPSHFGGTGETREDHSNEEQAVDRYRCAVGRSSLGVSPEHAGRRQRSPRAKPRRAGRRSRGSSVAVAAEPPDAARARQAGPRQAGSSAARLAGSTRTEGSDHGSGAARAERPA